MTALVSKISAPQRLCGAAEHEAYDFTSGFVCLNSLCQVIEDWQSRLRANGSDLNFLRLLENIEAVDIIDGNMLLTWRDGGADGAHVHQTLDLLHSQISSGLYGLAWPTGANGFHLLNGGCNQISGGRGYISQNEHLCPESTQIIAPDEQNPLEKCAGVAAQMKDISNFEERLGNNALPDFPTPGLIVELAAEVLSVKEWSLRGISTTLEPDARARSILAYCFVALVPCDPQGFAAYMNYGSMEEIKSDAKNGEVLMEANPQEASIGKLLWTALLGLQEPDFPMEVEEDGDAIFPLQDVELDENVVSIKAYREQLGSDEVVKGLGELFSKLS
ncbi:MAG: hypothetical protein WA782_11215 [Sulfitobacter sp.]